MMMNKVPMLFFIFLVALGGMLFPFSFHISPASRALLTFRRDSALAARQQPSNEQEMTDRKEAETLVKRFAKQSLQIINSPSLSAQEKKKKFIELFKSNADIPFIADFCIGVDKDNKDDGEDAFIHLTPSQQERYYTLFLDFVANLYISHLTSYAKARITIDGSQYDSISKKTPRILVDTVVLRPNNSDGEAQGPLHVQWEIRRGADQKGTIKYKIIDLKVGGLSLALTQREQFMGILSSNNNDFNALLDKLDPQKSG